MFNLDLFFKTLSGISQKKSLCRILQNYYSKKLNIYGNVIEFGAIPDSNKNFSYIMKKNLVKKIFYSDKHIKKKNVIRADLNKNISIKKNFFDTALLFNVLEHLTDPENAKNQITKILKRRGVLVGSSPFLYRFHAAPSDYLRFTKPFFIQLFKKNFRIIKIENIGFGPFCVCFSLISDFTKKIPLINYILFTFAFLLDFILSKLVKYELKDIYPIAVYFRVQKK